MLASGCLPGASALAPTRASPAATFPARVLLRGSSARLCRAALPAGPGPMRLRLAASPSVPSHGQRWRCSTVPGPPRQPELAQHRGLPRLPVREPVQRLRRGRPSPGVPRLVLDAAHLPPAGQPPAGPTADFRQRQQAQDRTLRTAGSRDHAARPAGVLPPATRAATPDAPAPRACGEPPPRAGRAARLLTSKRDHQPAPVPNSCTACLLGAEKSVVARDSLGIGPWRENPQSRDAIAAVLPRLQHIGSGEQLRARLFALLDQSILPEVDRPGGPRPRADPGAGLRLRPFAGTGAQRLAATGRRTSIGRWSTTCHCSYASSYRTPVPLEPTRCRTPSATRPCQSRWA